MGDFSHDAFVTEMARSFSRSDPWQKGKRYPNWTSSLPETTPSRQLKPSCSSPPRPMLCLILTDGTTLKTPPHARKPKLYVTTRERQLPFPRCALKGDKKVYDKIPGTSTSNPTRRTPTRADRGIPSSLVACGIFPREKSQRNYVHTRATHCVLLRRFGFF